MVFGLLHPNPLGLTVFGLVMELPYLKARSLSLPILAHALNNILALALGSLGGRGLEEADPIGIFHLYYGLCCLVLAGFILAPFLRCHWPERGGSVAQFPEPLNGLGVDPPIPTRKAVEAGSRQGFR